MLERYRLRVIARDAAREEMIAMKFPPFIADMLLDAYAAAVGLPLPRRNLQDVRTFQIRVTKETAFEEDDLASRIAWQIAAKDGRAIISAQHVGDVPGVPDR